jgi:hypothetical protein
MWTAPQAKDLIWPKLSFKAIRLSPAATLPENTPPLHKKNTRQKNSDFSVMPTAAFSLAPTLGLSFLPMRTV